MDVESWTKPRRPAIRRLKENSMKNKFDVKNKNIYFLGILRYDVHKLLEFIFLLVTQSFIQNKV